MRVKMRLLGSATLDTSRKRYPLLAKLMLAQEVK
jgi:hypothetical protein